MPSLVGSEMCIRDRATTRGGGGGYTDGLADNESEASSSRFSNGNKDPLSHQLPHNKQNKKLHLVSPLEYSAMLKLYNNSEDADHAPPATATAAPQASQRHGLPPHHQHQHQQQQPGKDITPDSGVAMGGNNTDSNKSNKKGQQQQSRQSLISSSSSLNDLLGCLLYTSPSPRD